MSYRIKEQLGNDGKDGKTYCVVNRKGTELAMKTFKNTKSQKMIEREIEFQKVASTRGLSPRIYNCDLDKKFIVMDKMDRDLVEIFRKQKGKLTIKQQQELIHIFRELDDIGVFHADANPGNFMEKNGILYIIDFGMAKPITPKLIKRHGPNPNMKYMPLGVIIELRKFCPESRFKVLELHVAEVLHDAR